MYDISAEAIVELIKERLGISAAEEFPAEINPPYCLVLTPAARIELLIWEEFSAGNRLTG